MAQLEFFAPPPAFPDGFKHAEEIVTPGAEHALLNAIRELPFKEFNFHGHIGKRRTVSFGWAYDFSRENLERAPVMPEFLRSLRDTAAAFASLSPDQLEQVLVTEYGAGSGIGWHRDKAVFGEVVGISLLSSCQFRLRRNAGGKWDRCSLTAAPRSAYLLSGAARTEWEHGIPAVDTPRYSVTYRSIAGSR